MPTRVSDNIDDFSAASLHRFIDANVVASATARTDGWPAYPGMPAEHHEPHVIGPMAAHVVLPWIHQMFGNLKTWLRGTFHGVSGKHLQRYLDEFVYRFDRRWREEGLFYGVTDGGGP